MKEKRRCAIYTRKSVEDGLEQEFNSLDAQREAGENYIASQKSNGWVCLPKRYDDGGWSGGNIERPALKELIDDVKAGKIDIIVVYKIDRLSRSLVDFAELQATFDAHNVAFCAVTQEINTSTSAGRMMLNILMTFAQYEREIITERVKDKIAASKKRGKYCGGAAVLGYVVNRDTKKLEIVPQEARVVEAIYETYSSTRSLMLTALEMNNRGFTTKNWVSQKGIVHHGKRWKTGSVYGILSNPIYAGYTKHYETLYEGEHQAIIDRDNWAKIQNLMKRNIIPKTRERDGLINAPLHGIARCGCCGSLLRQDYTVRKGRKYCYLFCPKKASHETNCSLRRVPLGNIEQAILHQLSSLLTTPTLIRETLAAAIKCEESLRVSLLAEKDTLNKYIKELKLSALSDAGEVDVDELKRAGKEYREVGKKLKAISDPINEEDIIKSLSDVGAMWELLFPAERFELLRLLIDRVFIYPDKVVIRLQREGLESLIKEMSVSGYFKDVHQVEEQPNLIMEQHVLGDSSVELTMPLVMKKIDGHCKVIVPDSTNTLKQESILRAIRKSQEWREMLESGQVKNVLQLAKQLGHKDSYVTRILTLSNLSPKIVSAICQGEEPETLSLARLFKGFPDDWQAQEQELGVI